MVVSKRCRESQVFECRRERGEPVLSVIQRVRGSQSGAQRSRWPEIQAGLDRVDRPSIGFKVHAGRKIQCEKVDFFLVVAIAEFCLEKITDIDIDTVGGSCMAAIGVDLEECVEFLAERAHLLPIGP